MSPEINRPVSSERLFGVELVRAAEGLLAATRPDPVDPALTLQLATAQALLALYWELRHQQPAAATADDAVGQRWTSQDSSMEWLSALLSSGLSTIDPPAAA